MFYASVQCYECSSPQQQIQIYMLIFNDISHENCLRDKCVVIVSRLRARRSLILPSSTNTSLNHLLSSNSTYVNHFIKTHGKFFDGTFYYFVGELFSSCVIVDGSRSRQVFGSLKVVMNASSKNQESGCISEINSCINSKRMIVQRLP